VIQELLPPAASLWLQEKVDAVSDCLSEKVFGVSSV